MRKPTETAMNCFLIAVLLLLLSRLAGAETIPLQCRGGTCLIPVRMNNAITINFLLDSGSALVMIPADVVLTLVRTGTVNDGDFIAPVTATLADGSKRVIKRFILHELRVGSQVVRNVSAGVNPVQGPPLLGQSFLSKLPAWMIDNQQHALVLNGVIGSSVGQQMAALPPKRTPPLSPPAQTSAPASYPSLEALLERARQAHA